MNKSVPRWIIFNRSYIRKRPNAFTVFIMIRVNKYPTFLQKKDVKKPLINTGIVLTEVFSRRLRMDYAIQNCIHTRTHTYKKKARGKIKARADSVD